MIRHPYGHDELDRDDPKLDAIAERLQDYAADERSGPPIDLAARIHAAIEAEPDPAVGWWARLIAPFGAWSTPARGVAAAAVVAAAFVVALVAGDLADLVRGPGDVGTTPSQPAIVTSTQSPTPTLSPTPTPSPSPSPSPSPTPMTPSPSATDELETPEPSESDNSGPGGGGGDDNSGPGGGGSSGSGSDD